MKMPFVETPLTGGAQFHSVVYRIEYLSFVQTPQRRDQQRSGTVPGEPVYDDFRGEPFQTVNDQICVGRLG